MISTITLQCVDEFYVRGNSKLILFDEMVALKASDGTHFLNDWDYLVCEWYPHINQVITRRSRMIPKSEAGQSAAISAVGPKESYFAQVLTVIANVFPFLGPLLSRAYLRFLGTNFSDGLWVDRICADPQLSLAFHPIDYIEIVIPARQYQNFMYDLREYYKKNPKDRPYCPVISDWIAGDAETWIGKNSTHDLSKEPWFCAITVMHQHIEASDQEQIFRGPVALARQYGARMHWGKNPWMTEAAQIGRTLPAGNFERFLELRKRKDPRGLFMNPFFRTAFAVTEKPQEKGSSTQIGPNFRYQAVDEPLLDGKEMPASQTP